MKGNWAVKINTLDCCFSLLLNSFRGMNARFMAWIMNCGFSYTSRSEMRAGSELNVKTHHCHCRARRLGELETISPVR